MYAWWPRGDVYGCVRLTDIPNPPDINKGSAACPAKIRKRQIAMRTRCQATCANLLSPLASLVFVTPILLVYELGVIVLGPAALRNGAEQWLRTLLELIGMGQYVLLPMLTCGLLLGWQHLSRRPWRFAWSTLPKMVTESFVVATGVICFAYFQHHVFRSLELTIPVPPVCSIHASKAAQVVGYCGAGFYEEVVFRLMLIPTLAGLLRWLGESREGAMWGGAIAASLIFSAAHYDVFSQSGDAFCGWTFTFRFLAGLVFSVVFLKRGFGIAAGSHTLYDLYVAWLSG